MKTRALQLGVWGLCFVIFNLPVHAKDVCRDLSFTFGDPSAVSKDEPPVWDLDGLYGYSGPEDLRIDDYLGQAAGAAVQFQRLYSGMIKSKKLSAQRLLAAIKNYENILSRVKKVEVYAFALVTINANDTPAQTLKARVATLSSNISSQLAFFEWELSQADRAHIRKLLATGKLDTYRHFIEKILERGPYQLPTRAQEEMLATLEPHLEATARIRDNLDANLIFEFQKPGTTLTETHTAESLRKFIKDDPDPRVRQAAQEALLAVYHRNRQIFADLYSEFVRTQITLRKTLRHYPHVTTPRHLSNGLNDQDVDRLVQNVVSRYPLVQRHWELKRKALGLGAVFTSADVDAPFLQRGESPPTLTWAQIRRDALAAAEPYAPPKLLKFLDETCLRRCIHARSTPGKEKGGYMATSVPEIPPIVLMHFNGTPWDRHALVHEMIIGHGFDFHLQSEQPFLNFGGSGMFRAETASTFAELLLLDYLMKQATDQRSRLRTLMSFIDEVNTTIFREIVYYLFELDVYAHVEKYGSIDANTLEQIWMKRYLEYFGDGVTPVNHFEALWAFPSHFYDPFYVYSYTGGQLAGIRMFMKLMKNPKYFERIMAAYRRGSSDAVKTIYRENLDIDLDNHHVWVPPFQFFEKLIDDEEALIKEVFPRR